MRRRSEKKVYQAHIEKLSHDGRGIAHLDGKVVFVDGALPGEQVVFQITRNKRQYAEALAIAIENPSADRVEPECPHYGLCGGCALQHLSSEAQLALKQDTFLEQLSQACKTPPETILPPLKSPAWHYRQKARLGVKHVLAKHSVLVGFREKNGRFITDMSTCKILSEPVASLIPDLRLLIASLEARDLIPQIEVAITETETALVIRHLEPLTDADVQALTTFGAKHQLLIYLQPKGPDSTHCLSCPDEPKKLIHYTLDAYELTFFFHPLDFTQVNAHINTHMIQQALDLLELTSEDTVLDLFSGLGNFTLPMAQAAKQVTGVEGCSNMTQRAEHNAQHNQLSNTRFYADNLADIQPNAPWLAHTYNKVLLDPPRTGAAELIPTLAQINPERIVYVSCNPATLVRDLALLTEQGFVLKAVGVMDMFPHTRHVESMALLVSENHG